MEFVEAREAAKATFPELDVTFSEDAWGPINGSILSAFGSVPYAHFDKKERCNRPADFSMNSLNSRYIKTRRYDENNQNADFAYKHDSVEDSSFQLVDTSKTQSRNKFGPAKRTWAPLGGRGGAGGRGAARSTEPLVGAAAAAGRGRGRPQQNNRGRQNRNRKIDRSSSVTVGSSWVVVEEFDLAQMTKLIANKPTIEDLSWHGHLDQYDETYDKVSARLPKNLKRVENKVFHGVTTTEDPVLEKYAVDGVGNVFATDQILAHLIAAPRSVYSWDIVIQKVDGTLFFDKRPDSQFDLLTVSETANDPPVASDDIDEINHPDRLSVEATMINQNFTQQILKGEDTRKGVCLCIECMYISVAVYTLLFIFLSVRRKSFFRGRRRRLRACLHRIPLP